MTALAFVSDLANLLMFGGAVIGLLVTILAWWLDGVSSRVALGDLKKVLADYLCDFAYFISRIVWGFVTCCAVINFVCIILIYMNWRIYG